MSKFKNGDRIALMRGSEVHRIGVVKSDAMATEGKPDIYYVQWEWISVKELDFKNWQLYFQTGEKVKGFKESEFITDEVSGNGRYTKFNQARLF